MLDMRKEKPDQSYMAALILSICLFKCHVSDEIIQINTLNKAHMAYRHLNSMAKIMAVCVCRDNNPRVRAYLCYKNSMKRTSVTLILFIMMTPTLSPLRYVQPSPSDCHEANTTSSFTVESVVAPLPLFKSPT